MNKAVYIHIPFCKNICSYCDFCKMFITSEWSYKYLDSLKEEIKDRYLGEEIHTLYIGGGTPSALDDTALLKLKDILSLFNLHALEEFTFECNLDDINEKLLTTLKTLGVTRLSIGIQSFNHENLKILERRHTYKEAEDSIMLARKLGFNNINLDLIYAIPGETLKDLESDLKLFLKLKPNHISTYSLMIMPHTKIYLRHFSPISEDEDYAMYHYICRVLKKKGFNHYEVSNFALKGHESKHNLTYWNNDYYYGFGLSASGYYDGIRYTNTYNFKKYLNGEYDGERNILTKKDIMDNEIMLGMRKLKGINILDFKNKFGIDIEDAYPIKPLLKNKDLIKKGEYIFIAPDKLYVMNEILMKMI